MALSLRSRAAHCLSLVARRLFGFFQFLDDVAVVALPLPSLHDRVLELLQLLAHEAVEELVRNRQKFKGAVRDDHE